MQACRARTCGTLILADLQLLLLCLPDLADAAELKFGSDRARETAPWVLVLWSHSRLTAILPTPVPKRQKFSEIFRTDCAHSSMGPALWQRPRCHVGLWSELACNNDGITQPALCFPDRLQSGGSQAENDAQELLHRMRSSNEAELWCQLAVPMLCHSQVHILEVFCTPRQEGRPQIFRQLQSPRRIGSFYDFGLRASLGRWSWADVTVHLGTCGIASSAAPRRWGKKASGFRVHSSAAHSRLSFGLVLGRPVHARAR